VPDRAVYFGLSSNVKFFTSHLGFAKLANRVKGLSLLSDRILFREGVYEATVGEQGSWITVGPMVRPDQLKPLRNRRGAPFMVTIAKTGSSEQVPVIATSTVQLYRAQFIPLLDEMASAGADWADHGQIQPAGARVADDVANQWTETEEAIVSNLWPDTAPQLRDIAHKRLNQDLATASLLGCIWHLTGFTIHSY
jgi:hypothetical protein